MVNRYLNGQRRGKRKNTHIYLFGQVLNHSRFGKKRLPKHHKHKSVEKKKMQKHEKKLNYRSPKRTKTFIVAYKFYAIQSEQ